MAEVLAVVISDGVATRRRIEEVRGARQLAVGPDGPVSLGASDWVLPTATSAILTAITDRRCRIAGVLVCHRGKEAIR
jgi:hypothetical protein